jgi:hypothetical protein
MEIRRTQRFNSRKNPIREKLTFGDVQEGVQNGSVNGCDCAAHSDKVGSSGVLNGQEEPCPSASLDCRPGQ